MGDTPRKPDRILLALLGVVGVLVVVALAVVFTRGGPPALDPASAAGVVQRYSSAVIDGDTATADSYLTNEARKMCGGGYYSGEPKPSRVVLVSTTERSDSATVRVSIVHSAPGGPFGPSEYEMEDSFRLSKAGGKWLIEQAPYPLQACDGPVVKK